MTEDTTTPTHLTYGYGTSRGRDTYGYNIVRLTDQRTGRTFRCMGGGYDMQGTVLADWAVATHQDRLMTLADRAFYVSDSDGYRRTPEAEADPHGSGAFYGMARIVDDHGTRVSIDGGCGVSSVLRILDAAGLELTRTYIPTGRRRGETTGYMVETVES